MKKLYIRLVLGYDLIKIKKIQLSLLRYESIGENLVFS